MRCKSLRIADGTTLLEGDTAYYWANGVATPVTAQGFERLRNRNGVRNLVKIGPGKWVEASTLASRPAATRTA